MTKKQFNPEETKFINAPINDPSHNIYASFPALSSTCYIFLHQISQGKYTIELYSNNNVQSFIKSLRHLGKLTFINGTKVCFNLKLNRSFVIFAELELAQGVQLVKELRKQMVLNQQKIAEKKRLIAKQIKTYTNLGEEYNRNSFIDTILECMENNEELLVDCTKSAKDQDVKFLCLMQIAQQENNIANEQQILDNKKLELEKRKTELLKQ